MKERNREGKSVTISNFCSGRKFCGLGKRTSLRERERGKRKVRMYRVIHHLIR